MFNDLLKSYSWDEIISALSPLLLDERKAKIESVLNNRISGFELAVEAPSCIYNALALIRTAEAFGVDHFHLIESEVRRKQGKSTTSGSNKWVDVHQYDQLGQFFTGAAQNSLQVVGACIESTQTLEEVDVSKPLCLLFGNEQRGLSQAAMSQCHATFSINMFGMVESLNIASAAAIATYVIQKKIREVKPPYYQAPEAIKEKIARFYLKTVGVKVARAVLMRGIKN